MYEMAIAESLGKSAQIAKTSQLDTFQSNLNQLRRHSPRKVVSVLCLSCQDLVGSRHLAAANQRGSPVPRLLVIAGQRTCLHSTRQAWPVL